MEWNRISFNNIGYNLYKLIGIGTELFLFLLTLRVLTNIILIRGAFFEKYYHDSR